MATPWGEIVQDSEAVSSKVERFIASTKSLFHNKHEDKPPLINQPSSRHFPPGFGQIDENAYKPDPLVSHTVKLQQYAKEVKELISKANSLYESMQLGEGEIVTSQLPPVPHLPLCDGCLSEEKLNTSQLPFIHPPKDSAFYRGIGTPCQPLEDSSCRRLLKHSVALLCAHTGFESTTEDVLDTLTDATQAYLQRMTQYLRTFSDYVAREGMLGNLDPIQQTLCEVGITGGVSELHDFYNTHVVQKHTTMVYQCQRLRDVYRQQREVPASYRAQQVATDSLNLPVNESLAEKRMRTSSDEEENVSDMEEDAQTLLQLAEMSGYAIKLEQDEDSGPSQERSQSVASGEIQKQAPDVPKSTSSGKKGGNSSSAKMKSAASLSTEQKEDAKSSSHKTKNSSIGVQSSTKGGGVQSSTKGGGVQSSTKGGGVQSSTKGSEVQSSTKGGGVQSSTKGGGVQSSTKGGAKGNAKKRKK